MKKVTAVLLAGVLLLGRIILRRDNKVIYKQMFSLTFVIIICK
ncbi:hypothetical protein [Petrotoga sp. 9PWA.NaAc.5.4]|nr:hypothetical protein [Petrotoga sp. 9PWA.NaAc.5.4]